MEEQRRFLGRGVKFPLQVDPRTGKFAMVSQEEDIQEAIGIILNTVQGRAGHAAGVRLRRDGLRL